MSVPLLRSCRCLCRVAAIQQRNHNISRGITTKLFVAGLSFETTETTLAQRFSPFGGVIDAKIIRDRNTQRHRGFGFVQYASEAEAEKAKAQMNGQIIDNRVVFVDIAKRGPQLVE